MMDDRGLFSSEHEAFRESVRRFIEDEIAPYHNDWEEQRGLPRELWRKAGELGFLCCDVPEEYGGAGADWLYNVVVIEEFWRAGMSGPGGAFLVHSEVVTPYLLASGNEELKRKWLPRMVSGDAIGALGMTEPSGGSDVQNIQTRAIKDGDDYVINGQKIFISNGISCDFVVLVTKTDPTKKAKGITLFLVEKEREGFDKGRNLKKIGAHAADLAELFFSDVRVPAANMLSEEGKGFGMVIGRLVQERLTQAIRSVSVCEAAIDWTIKYTRERKAFGHTIGDFQNTQFVLAELHTETTSARIFVDWAVRRFMEGKLSPVDGAKVKLLTSVLQAKVVDSCLQFFGGYGYMREYPIARAFVDSRLVRIGGGAVEVLKHIIGRDLFKPE
jgi:alkylation response protein AidB-like acyl-CoA dehydrogenase